MIIVYKGHSFKDVDAVCSCWGLPKHTVEEIIEDIRKGDKHKFWRIVTGDHKVDKFVAIACEETHQEVLSKYKKSLAEYKLKKKECLEKLAFYNFNIGLCENFIGDFESTDKVYVVPLGDNWVIK